MSKVGGGLRPGRGESKEMTLRRSRVWAGVAVGALLAVAACSGGSEGDTPQGEEDTTLTIWTTEDQADRVATQQKLMNDWGAKSGTTVKLVAIAEDQLTTTL